MRDEKFFNVWADTTAGDLMTFGTNPGRGLSREQAWETVKALKTAASETSDAGSLNHTTYIRVFYGCSRVWATARLGDGTWTI